MRSLKKLGQQAGLKDNFIADTIDQTKTALQNWTALAKTYGVFIDTHNMISDYLGQID